MASQFTVRFPRARRSASVLDLYLGLVSAAGLLVLGLLLRRDAAGAFGDIDLTFWVLAVFVLPAEIMRVNTWNRGGVHQLTMSRPFALVLLTGWGAAPTVVVFVIASVVSDLIYRKPLLRIPFNAGQYTLSIAAASLVYTALGGQPSLQLEQIPAFIAAAVVLILMNRLLVRVAVALYEQHPMTIGYLLAEAQVELVEGAVQCGVVLVALLLIGQRPVLPLVLVTPALPLFVAGRATAEVEILRRTRPLGRVRASAELNERRAVVQSLLRATELERVKLAADLHDGPLQQIDQLMARIREVQASIEAGRPERRLVDQLEREVPELGRQLRLFVTELRPRVMQRHGLVGALTHLAREFQTSYGIEFDVQAKAVERLPEELGVLLYRVTQEALTNIVKHAHASHVHVAVAMDDGVVRLQIQDDGVGFQPAEAQEGHYGLAIMRERVEMAGGTFQVDSMLGGGSTITADIQARSLP
jgi:signal transduction histidine kinase